MPTVLVVDDEPSVRDILSAYLEKAGFRAITAPDGLEAIATAEAERPDLVVLDLMLPGLDGLAVCRSLRATSSVPILMLTARGEGLERVRGLDLGADDYLGKPFDPNEVVARVRAILRRTAGELAPAALQRGELRVEPAARLVELAGRPVELSPLEFDLLHALASQPGRVFTRDALLRAVWGDGFPVDRVVDVHVANLRRKLGDDPDAPRFVETVRGVGYRFVERELPA